MSGILSDRFGARGFATAGMLVFAASFIGLMLLPVDFPYFPRLIASAFHHGLVVVFSVAAGLSVLGALASLARGGRYVHVEPASSEKGTPHDRLAPSDRPPARGPARDGLPERDRRHARRT